jgi:D-alanine-D-alanine ligase
MRILLLTGPGGDAQGWGDLQVTESIREAAIAAGHPARIAWVETEADFMKALDLGGFDIVWSALYHLTSNDRFIGRNNEGPWVADVLDDRAIPYIGSDSQTMKDMIDKHRTHTILARKGIPVPGHRLAHSQDDLSDIRYPVFVKPVCESRSIGISDESVVYSEEDLRRRTVYIEREFEQPALVEDFLPGDEFTVLVLGNGTARSCLPGLVSVDDWHYGRHRVLRSDLRGVGITRIGPAGHQADQAKELADRAAEAMHCLDHVRIDLKTDAEGSLRIIEVNGIPGLKPHKSWAPQLFTLHYRSSAGEAEDYERLIGGIIDAARRRYGM